MFERKSLAPNVVKLLLSSCVSSTWTQYNTYFLKWQNFCNVEVCSVISPTVNHVLSFLTSLYESGLGYSSVNTARSSLSLFLSKIEGYNAGDHPLVCRLVRAIGKNRPPQARYSTIWDAGMVLNVFKKWKNNDELSLAQLTYKCAALLALVSAQRVQTLSLIKVSNMKFTETLTIFIKDNIKTSAPGRVQPTIIVPRFISEPKLCVFSCVSSYLEKTLPIRKSDCLFLTLVKPHSAASTQTISRWLKVVLIEAKVNTSIYKSHSYRHAATSKAKDKGVCIDSIFRTAGWTTGSSTFANFYSRPITNINEFAEAILN